jgi:acetyl esterase/lipase
MTTDTLGMDPEIAAAVAAFPPIDIGDLASARAVFAGLRSGGAVPHWAASVDVVERAIPGPVGAPEVPVRIYTPRAGAGPLPAIVYFHGGSFVVGDLDTHHLGCGAWAAEVGAVVVNVDYRLAPEHPFPAGIEDSYATLCWAAERADELGIDAGRIAVAGSSAGGGLAACVALLARDRGGPTLAFQLLAYPVLDDRLDTDSMRRFTDTPIFDARAAAHAWRYYLGADRGEVPPYAAPARATNLAGLPPAFLLGCDLDPLRDEGIAYAARLLAAGVPVELHQYPGTVHGFDVLPSRVSEQARRVQVEALRRGLAPRAPIPSSFENCSDN